MSLPMTIRCRCGPLRMRYASARPSCSAISAVIGWTFATPRTPSVPNSAPLWARRAAGRLAPFARPGTRALRRGEGSGLHRAPVGSGIGRKPRAPAAPPSLARPRPGGGVAQPRRPPRAGLPASRATSWTRRSSTPASTQRGDRRRGSRGTLARRRARRGELPDEALPRRAHEERRPSARSSPTREQLDVLLRGLREADPGIEDDRVRAIPAASARRAPRAARTDLRRPRRRTPPAPACRPACPACA